MGFSAATIAFASHNGSDRHQTCDQDQGNMPSSMRARFENGLNFSRLKTLCNISTWTEDFSATSGSYEKEHHKLKTLKINEPRRRKTAQRTK